MSIRIDQPGLRASVQDLGRLGHGASGVGPAGAADPLSLRIGNRLIGNSEGDAAIEMTLTGATLRVQRDALVCLTGGHAPEAIVEHDGRARPLAGWTPTPVHAGSRIVIGPVQRGCRVYLCVDGGIATEPVLGSRSAHGPTGIGGVVLRAGDALPLGTAPRGVRTTRPTRDLIGRIEAQLHRRTLRLAPGAQHEWFDDLAKRELAAFEFRVGDRSDRTGVRFDGPAIPVPEASLRSEGVVTGSLQIPTGGRPIALLTDRPATGGYPVIGCIIGADLPALGQLRPREQVRFDWTQRDVAIDALREQESLIASVPSPKPTGHARQTP